MDNIITDVIQISNICIVERNYNNVLHNTKILINDVVNMRFNNKKPMIVITGNVFEYRTASIDDINILHMMLEMFENNKIHVVIFSGTNDRNISKRIEFIDNNVKTKQIIVDTIDIILKNTSYKYIHHNDTILGNISIVKPNNSKFDNSKFDNSKTDASTIVKIVDCKNIECHGECSIDNLDYKDDNEQICIYLVICASSQHYIEPQKWSRSGNFIQKYKDTNESGYIIWNLRLQSADYVKIKMNEQHLILRAEDNKCHLPDVIPRSISLLYKNCDDEWLSEFKNIINTKYKKSINYIEESYENGENSECIETKFDISTMTSLKKQCYLISDYLKKQNISTKTQLEILKLHTEYHQKYKTHEWIIKSLSWDNIMCYNDSNFINFENIDGIASIIGNTRSGKSAILDILVFILFNLQLRGKKAELLNSSKKMANIKCIFDIADDEYVIERTIKHNSATIKFTKNNSIMSIDIAQTYIILKDLIGSFDNYKDSFFALQDRKSILNMNTDEIYELIASFLGFRGLVEIENNVSHELKSIYKLEKSTSSEIDEQQKISSISGDTNKRKITQMELNCINLKIRKEKLLVLADKLNHTQTQLQKKYEEAKKIYDTLADKSKKSCNKISIDNDFKYDMKALERRRVQLEILLKIHKKCDVPNIDIDVRHKHMILPQSIDDIKTEISHIKGIITEDKNFITNKTEMEIEAELRLMLDCGRDLDSACQSTPKPHISTSRQNSALSDMSIDECKAKIRHYEDMLAQYLKTVNMSDESFSKLRFDRSCKECNANFNTISDWNDKYNTYKDINIVKIEDCMSKIADLKIVKSKLEDETNRKNLDQQRYIADLQHDLNIFKNKNLKKKLLMLESELCKLTNLKHDELQSEYDEIIYKITFKKMSNMSALLGRASKNHKIHKKIDKLSDTIKTLENEIVEAKKCENKNDNHHKEILELYFGAINKKTGVFHHMIYDICQLVNNRANSILGKITDFKIKLDFDKHFNLSINTSSNIDKFISSDMCSGFQSFIVDFVIRMTLASLSREFKNTHRPNFIIFDEGFGCLDKDNIYDLLHCLSHIKKKFKFIMIISHIRELQLMSDTKIYILSNKIHSKCYFE
jgi:DNA repair exonuclease SbcCD ATPase subunit